MSPDGPPKSLTDLKHPFVEMTPHLIEIVVGLHSILGPAKADLWLKAPNSNFGEIAPLRLIQIGRGHKVREFIDNAIYENDHGGLGG